MRKLFAGILLAAALPASASISSELAAGDASVADIINNAMAACGGGAACQEQAIADAVAAGVDMTTVINLAVASGVDAKAAVTAVSEAGLKNGVSVDAVLSAALAAKGVPAAIAVGGVTAGAEKTGVSAQAAQNAVKTAATKLNVDPQVVATVTQATTKTVVKKSIPKPPPLLTPTDISPAK